MSGGSSTDPCPRLVVGDGWCLRCQNVAHLWRLEAVWRYCPVMGAGVRYPENSMEFAPEYPDDIPESWQRFLDLREEMLLGYSYNTARAYWGDLQDWFEWAVARKKDVLALTEKDEKQYYALLGL